MIDSVLYFMFPPTFTRKQSRSTGVQRLRV